jgi:hypothetical protein
METFRVEDKQQPIEEVTEGVSASMHAPIEVATHIKVNSTKEMLEMSTAKTTKRRLPITDRNQTTVIKRTANTENVPGFNIDIFETLCNYMSQQKPQLNKYMHNQRREMHNYNSARFTRCNNMPNSKCVRPRSTK